MKRNLNRLLWVLFLAGTLWFSLVLVSRSSLIGIDFGNDNSKVASIRPGRGIEIVLNSHSQRKTATAVSFSSSSPSLVRTFGEDALSGMTRNPTRTLLHIPSFLGMCGGDILDSSAETGTGKGPERLPNGLRRDFFPYAVEQNKELNGGLIRVDGLGVVPEELAAHYLDFLRRMVEGSIGKKPKSGGFGRGGAKGMGAMDPGPILGSETVGAVIAVPPRFTQRQRRSLVDAAEIAGLNLFGLVNSLGAAAVHQSTDLSRSESSTFLYYDMGAKHISSCVVEFRPANATHMGKTVQTHRINVLGCGTDTNSGSYLADLAIADIVIQRIREAPAKSPLAGVPLDNSRVLQKIAKQSVRTKLLLSTLKHTDFFVESLYKDVDISQSISREEFERALEKVVLARAVGPVEESLRVANRTMSDITDVEILGGGVRVPGVRALLDRYFGSFGRNVSQRLNGDEAMAFGAAFVAANQSATFRTRSIFYGESSSEDYSLRLGEREIPLVNSSLHFHGVHVLNVQSERDFEALLLENGRPISRFNISGVQDLISGGGGSDEIQSPLNVTLEFKVDTYGIISLESVYGWKMTNQTIKVPVTLGANSTQLQSQDGGEAALEKMDNGTISSGEVIPEEANSTISEGNSTKVRSRKGGSKIVYEEKVILRPAPFALKFSEDSLECPTPLSKELKKSISHHINELNKLDAKHRQLMDSKNSLEALIYDNRNKLYDDTYLKVTLETEREEISKLLSEIEDWLYEIGDNITLELVEENILRISNKTDVVHLKAEELRFRDELVEGVDKKLSFTIQTFEAIKFTHTWVQNSTFSEVEAVLDDFQSWYNQTKARQAELKPTDEPVLLRKETLKRLETVVSNVQRVRSIPKPRPKPKYRPKKPGNETQPSSNSTNFNETSSGATDTNLERSSEKETSNSTDFVMDSNDTISQESESWVRNNESNSSDNNNRVKSLQLKL